MSILDTKIEFLKGVGPKKSILLNNELSIFTFLDLLTFYPFRYLDRTNFYNINQIIILLYFTNNVADSLWCSIVLFSNVLKFIFKIIFMLSNLLIY